MRKPIDRICTYLRHTKIVYIIVLAIIHICAYAQPVPMPQSLDKYKVIDNTDYVITYELIFKKDARKLMKGLDVIIVEVGKDFSKSYSKVLFDADSTSTEWLKKGTRVLPTAKESVPLEDVYKNLKTKKSKIVFRSILTGPIYLYEEESNLMDWTLRPEKKEILSYSCQRATTTFRGRDYEAWFTNDIPIPNGPWKFGGLPGLILSIKDIQDHFVFECVGIQKPKKQRPIKFWSWNYKSINREQLLRLKKRMYLNTYNYCISIGQAIGGDPVKARRKMNYPYNPIELQ